MRVAATAVSAAALMMASTAVPVVSAFYVSNVSKLTLLQKRAIAQKRCQLPVPKPTLGFNGFEDNGVATALKSTNGNVEREGFLQGLTINPPFALAYVGFLGFAYFMTTAEAAGASQEVLDKFLADPINPGVNELFATVFNLLGLAGLPMACLMMPGASDQKLPATPFLIGSAFGGYGALGPYAATRKAVTSVKKSELGWFTANVLENKVFNWVVVAMALSTLYVTGSAEAMLTDPAKTIQGYVDLFSSTAIASASSVDLAILSLTAASLIPEDLERRGVSDSGKASVIAASTLLLPIIGSTIYCALRPSLEED